MARIEKMELCVGKLSFIELSALHRKDSIVLARVKTTSPNEFDLAFFSRFEIASVFKVGN
jgi:hypothetical protein